MHSRNNNQDLKVKDNSNHITYTQIFWTKSSLEKPRRENQCSGLVDLLLAARKYGVLLQIKLILLNSWVNLSENLPQQKIRLLINLNKSARTRQLWQMSASGLWYGPPASLFTALSDLKWNLCWMLKKWVNPLAKVVLCLPANFLLRILNRSLSHQVCPSLSQIDFLYFIE